MKFQVFRSSGKQFETEAKKRLKAPLLVAGSLMALAPALSWAVNQGPTPVVTVSPSTGQAPFTTTFDGSKSTDADGTITAYSWKFGDGTAAATSSKATHTFSTAGTYSVSFKVTDNSGTARTTSLTITVAPPPAPAIADVPNGVFASIGTGVKVPDSLLNNADVAGIILREQWKDVETADNVYDWSYFDSEIARVTSANKKVAVLVNMGGQTPPDWLMKLNVAKFSFVNQNSNQGTYGTTITIPVFWDAVYMQKKLEFIAAFGLRYSSNPNVAMVDAQCANATTSDWNVPSTTTDISNWKKLGFTSDKLLTACKQTVDATIAAFPKQTVKMAIGRLSSSLDTNGDSDYVATSLLAYENSLHPARFIVERYNLSAATADPLTATSDLGGWRVIYDNRPNNAAQMLWSVTGDSTCRMNNDVAPCDPYTVLDKAVTTGINYGMQFLEIYQADIDNPALSPIIHKAATSLGR